jgi:hypothetical protein
MRRWFRFSARTPRPDHRTGLERAREGLVRGHQLRNSGGQAPLQRCHVRRRLYLVTAPDSWKARQISDGDQVAVTVPIRRGGGLLSLIIPIPPATVSFHATARVHPAGPVSSGPAPKRLVSHLPKQRREAGCLLELVPEGDFLTYGLGVPLQDMAKPDAALAHVPVR